MSREKRNVGTYPEPENSAGTGVVREEHVSGSVIPSKARNQQKMDAALRAATVYD